jgi:hypothetical protein
VEVGAGSLLHVQPKRFWNSLTKATFKKVKLDDAISPNAFIGKAVTAQLGGKEGSEEEVIIKSVGPCIGQGLEKYLTVNETHVCHTFSFFSQLMEGRKPTDEELSEFELASDVVKIKELSDGSTKGKQKQVESGPGNASPA